MGMIPPDRLVPQPPQTSFPENTDEAIAGLFKNSRTSRDKPKASSVQQKHGTQNR
jgi:hypothetical protein